MGWQDILKSYDLEEFIVKSKGSKKKKGEKDIKVDIPGGTLTVTQTAMITKLQNDMKRWYETCSSLKMEDIGIVGEKGNTSLLDFIMDHVDQRVQRPKQETKVGAMDTIKDIMEIVREDDIYTKEDLKTVQQFIETLEEIEKDSRSNPKNIIFTEQHSRTKTVTVRGHYRTPWFERKTGKKAVPEGWYDLNAGPGKTNDKSQAKPPMWQALFNGRTLQKSTVPGLERGLLTLLIDFEEEMKNQKISDIPIVGKQGRERVIQIQGVIKGLSNILANQESYHSTNEPFKRLWLNVENVRKQLNAFDFEIATNDKKGVEAIRSLVPALEDSISENLGAFRIIKITPGLLRSVVRRMGINLDTFAHGGYRGIFLHRPWTTKSIEGRKKLWETEYKKAKKDGNLPRWAERDDEGGEGGGGVKKSWEDILKLMPQRIEPMKNPAAGLHMPSVYNKARQAEISRDKGETCDFCEKDVVLDCRDCNQKLCYDHLNKPCVTRKSFAKAERKEKQPVRMAGGEISISDLRRLFQEIDDDFDEEDEDIEKELVLVVIPTMWEDGSKELKFGVFTYNFAKQHFGDSQLKRLIENAAGIAGARLVAREDLTEISFGRKLKVNAPMQSINME